MKLAKLFAEYRRISRKMNYAVESRVFHHRTKANILVDNDEYAVMYQRCLARRERLVEKLTGIFEQIDKDSAFFRETGKRIVRIVTQFEERAGVTYEHPDQNV